MRSRDFKNRKVLTVGGLIITLLIIYAIFILSNLFFSRTKVLLEKRRGEHFGVESYGILNQISISERMYFAEYQKYWNSSGILSRNNPFDIHISERIGENWNFIVTTSEEYNFTATAIRKKGRCVNKKISLDQNGTLNTSDWGSCVSEL